jgi:hypothetical protein
VYTSAAEKMMPPSKSSSSVAATVATDDGMPRIARDQTRHTVTRRMPKATDCTDPGGCIENPDDGGYGGGATPYICLDNKYCSGGSCASHSGNTCKQTDASGSCTGGCS